MLHSTAPVTTSTTNVIFTKLAAQTWRSLLALRYLFLTTFSSLGRCRVLDICFTLLAYYLLQLLARLSHLFPKCSQFP